MPLEIGLMYGNLPHPMDDIYKFRIDLGDESVQDVGNFPHSFLLAKFLPIFLG